ncbi:MAG TPA: phenylalanine--tRNA ligase subunit beta, partial [Candidatus Methanomethylia archaeon]|nr:phenylalanine--tRNA ligase subunit beta [Candidatus Methanomethylicia archaeon]
MPTITMEIEELNKLVGRELSVEEIASFIERLKGEVEKVEDGEITAEVTSDRPDLFSVEGIARAIRLLLGMQPSSFTISEGSIEVFVKESVLQVRPAIACSAVREVSLNELAVAQIMQLQEKLHHTYGLRRKEASIGVYDLDKVTPPIYYEALPPEEIVFTPLN